MTKIAIIGAGLSGVVIAKELKDQATVSLFEKARGVSGRMATRSAPPYAFDHGAQFFIAKTPAFQSYTAPLIDAGLIQRWDARFVEFENEIRVCQRTWNADPPHYVAVPGMNAMVKHLATDCDVLLNTTIKNMVKADKWQLFDDQDLCIGEFDWVISTAPPLQAKAILPTYFAHYEHLLSTHMLGCFSLMLGFNKPLALDFDAALVREAAISWISVNSSKPGRGPAFSLLVHSTNHWAETHFNDDREAVMAALITEASRITGLDLNVADHRAIHGWRYANITKQAIELPLIDTENKLAATGDWCIQGRVESAYTSATTLASALSDQIKN